MKRERVKATFTGTGRQGPVKEELTYGQIEDGVRNENGHPVDERVFYFLRLLLYNGRAPRNLSHLLLRCAY